ncbi:L-rhamnose/proton symporter RhaT [Acinetobacter bereziniae]|uniref:L-rhamnose/proton symporter RhaT n=1 Tax=Acinetobacter bereziniae TaxID=106648 RepID=UPI00190235DE|nr:L-rhamnose/proton symporter RhaT [Acinetobacter bereziniae]MBJ8445745.1 L-rhamnose/proton symporter RhaT [Acinetobacter bereziniae]
MELIVLGVFLHFVGGFASGSFYIPYNKVSGWSWESYWIMGGIFSWLIVPAIAAYLTVPHFFDIILTASSKTLFWTYIFGVLWGIGGLTFGLTMRYLGLSLGMTIVLGLCSVFGAIIPPIYKDLFTTQTENTFTALIHSNGGNLIILGVIITIIGISICGKAGMIKEREVPDETKKESVKEFSLSKGLTVAIISGVLSACFSFGISAGKPLADMALTYGANSLFQNNVTFILIMWGGLTTNAIYCLFLNLKNKSYTDYTNTSTPLLLNYLLVALAGTLWYLQFFFYGMGESRLNNEASSWILHMSFIILTSNLWGFYFGEWKGTSSKNRKVIYLGILVILISVCLVGYGNYLNHTE